jgi:hypothetical protein
LAASLSPAMRPRHYGEVSAESTKLRLVVVAPLDLAPRRTVGSGKLHNGRSSYGYIGSHLALCIY